MPLRHDPALMEQVAREVVLLGVTEACRKHGIHRASWYRYAKTSPPSVPKVREDRDRLRESVRAIALETPAWGCDRIAYYLSFSGVQASSPTVQKLLIEMGLGRRSAREDARDSMHRDRNAHPGRAPRKVEPREGGEALDASATQSPDPSVARQDIALP